jgi:cytochrome P450
MNPVEAATNPNPYPFYSELAIQRPIYFDESLQMWVTSGASIVASILSDKRLGVRPSAAPVPAALVGLRSGDIFGAMMRMTDGPLQCPLKRSALESMNRNCIDRCSEITLNIMSSPKVRATTASLETVRRTMFTVPTYVMGTLFGIPSTELPQLLLAVTSFVVGLSPSATTEQRTIGDYAATMLFDRIEKLLEDGLHNGPLLRMFVEACSRRETDRMHVIANVIGFLFQTYDATAGLIGNSLRMLATDAALLDAIHNNPTQFATFVHEVMRYDPPVQNTRRYASEDVTLDGVTLRAGSQVLVVLAAANRDPARFDSPAEFSLQRTGPFSFGFGLGRHQCPGEPLAIAIASKALESLLSSEFEWASLSGPVSYRPSANVRIPLF